MFNYLKKAFGIKFDVPPYTLNSFQNEPDVRSIQYSTVMTPRALPLEYKTDISMLPAWYQVLGTCVAHSFTYTKMGLDYLETKKIHEYSPRNLYVKTRLFAGMETMENNQGLYPRDCAKVVSTIGLIVDENEPTGMSHVEYVAKYTFPENYVTQANIARSGGFTEGIGNEFEIKQAVYENKFVPVTILIDWDSFGNDGTVRTPKNVDGSHEVVCIGWDNLNGGRFILKNTWIGYDYLYVPFSDVEKVIADFTVFKDIPNDLIERAKATQYIFLTDLKMGSTGDAVTQLQKRLKEYGLFPKNQVFTRTFGNLTKQAVLDYQRLKGIQQTGTVGPITRKALNDDMGVSGVKKSKIDLWCEAIQDHEGFYPGSRSYRNHNPGNIKHIGQAKAVGKDSKGFAIFATYADGYMELRNMLVRACTGGSMNYKPTMTLLEFFAKYAPSSDNNNPKHYAETVAKKIGVSPHIQIKDLLV